MKVFISNILSQRARDSKEISEKITTEFFDNAVLKDHRLSCTIDF